MSRRILAFVRHAEYHQLLDAPSALQPFPLTDHGIKQAKQAALDMQIFLQKNEWALDAEVHSSSLLRAWQTAKIFTESLQAVINKDFKVHCFDDLVERSVGAAANLTIKQIEEVIEQDHRYESLLSNWKSNSQFKLPFVGAESLLEAGQRVAKHLTQSMAEMQGGVDCVKLFVGHGAAFRHAAYQLGIIDFAQIAQLSMHYAQPIYLEYLANGSWQQIAGEWKVRSKQNVYHD
ncbi:MAG: histidine phosphatase family protein [Methylophilaceae bacterium]